MTTVIYIGNHRVPTSSESMISAAFERLGHRVIRMNQDGVDARNFADEFTKLNETGIVLYTRTHNQTALSNEWTGVWRACEDAGWQTASIHLDLYRGLQREHLVDDHDPLFTVGTVFTPDASPEFWDARSINHRWMPPACGIPEPPAESGQPVPPVVFVGTVARYHPEHIAWRRALVDALRREYGNRFGLYGNDTTPVRAAALSRVYQEARVVVGDVCFGGHVDWYWSDRVPETLARQGVLVHPRVVGLPTLHPAVVTHDPCSIEGMLDAVVAAMECPPDRERRWETATETIAEHSWDVRLATLILPALGVPG